MTTWIRFEQILSAWRYLPEDERPQGRQSPFRAVNRFIATLAHNFQSRYQASQRLDIDEQCIPFKGRHSSRCYNSSKPCKFHLKVFALNDSETGYMLNCYLYEGASDIRPAGVCASLNPIIVLLQQTNIYANKGHILATVNWYTSVPLLTYVWKTFRMHFVGTCRAIRKEIPRDKMFPVTMEQ